MQLYEATNGFMGNSYVRCLVWADDEEEALDLATTAFKEAAEEGEYDESYWKNINLQLVVDSETDVDPFYTDVED
ncbi:hypothetical protein K7T73_13010 [Bacillus badius]|uniref:hypothetical protein n=1 Tax=Bacillus badius TaxID=1455 RepID=UPI001CBBDE02|nr:hypothetical protein [Bacillus badius]UAT29519.1 hypothetical protein K7T73_13010 [Bacillus badius]